MDEIYFKLKNNAKQLKHNLMIKVDSEQKKELAKNSKYKNIYSGKRCFIVGNGPSLKKQDLRKLKNEIVFTVNMMPKSSMYQELSSNFHVMVDPFIFQLNLEKEEDQEKLEILKKINTGKNKPVCFFPYVSKGVIEKYGLERFLDIAYLHFGGDFYEGYGKKIDITKCIPGFCNVVQFSILLAIYMGFREIYLLGCDMTVYEQVSVMYGKEVELHAYEMNENEKKAIKNTHEQMDIEQFFGGFCRTLSDYRRLYSYSKKRGIFLCNATAGGILESLPRVDYNTLF